MKKHAWPNMPSMGIADTLLSPRLDAPERFQFWLLSHTSPLGEAFWWRTILRECLPDPNAELIFETYGVSETSIFQNKGAETVSTAEGEQRERVVDGQAT